MLPRTHALVILNHSHPKLTSLDSSLVRHHLLQAHLTLHRPRHQIQDEIQRALAATRARRAALGRLWWRCPLRVRPCRLLARAVAAV